MNKGITVESLGGKSNWFGVSNLFSDKTSYSCWCTAPSRIFIWLGVLWLACSCYKRYDRLLCIKQSPYDISKAMKKWPVKSLVSQKIGAMYLAASFNNRAIIRSSPIASVVLRVSIAWGQRILWYYKRRKICYSRYIAKSEVGKTLIQTKLLFLTEPF